MGADLVAVRVARERIIARLSEHFAQDDLDLEEFERRLTQAHRAESVAEMEALVTDLPSRTALAVPAPAPAPKTALVPASSVRPDQRLVAIMGGAIRRGHWTAPLRLRVTAVLGGAELDFREARLPEGVTEVSIFALFGGVNIIVPPGLSVEMDGTAIMGGFEHMERSPVEPDPQRPVLRVSGFAMFGGVAVQTRLPGESERGARRRHRRERKALAAKKDER